MATVQEVVLLGKGKLAIQVGQWFLDSPDYSLVAVVPSMPPPAWTESFPDWARNKGLQIVESGRYEDLPQLQDPRWGPGLAFSVYYSRIIKPEFIQRCERILNLHNGPLPRYRGVSPVNWALKNNEHSHGVTIHEITPGIDDGPIVAQASFTIDSETDEVIDVYRRCLKFGFTLFEETMPRIESIRVRAQEESRALYYSKRDNCRLEERRSFTREDSLGEISEIR